MTTALAPNWIAGPTGKDPYRPWCRAVVDGVLLLANGHDQPWLVNDSVSPRTAETLGGAPPGEADTEHSGNGASPALDAGGTFLADTEEANYYVTFYNSRLGRETAPQSVSITNSSGGARQVILTWSDTGLEAWWDKVRIYRRFRDASGFKLIATVTASTGTYTDDTAWSALEALPAYLPRYRRTIAPILEGFVNKAGRILGWTGRDVEVHIGQVPDLITGTFIQDDFYRRELIGPGDHYGDVQAIVEHDAVLFVFKQKAIYAIEGNDPDTWTIRELFGRRGVVSRRMLVRVREYFAFLDTDGLHLWTPGGEPVKAGAAPGSNFSPLGPRWKSMNLAARKLFAMFFHEDTGEIEMHVACDGSPIPNRRIVYSTDEGVYTADEPLVFATEAGTLEEPDGTVHVCRGDELGFLWDQYIGTVEGVTSGAIEGAIDESPTKLLWPFDVGVTWSATKEGPAGSPIEHSDADGVLIDTNRCYAAGTGSMTPLYWRPDDVTEGDLIEAGGITYLVETPPKDGGTSNDKRFLRLFLEFETEDAGATALVETDVDGAGWNTVVADLDLSLPKRQNLELDGDFGCELSLRVTQRGSGYGIAWTLMDLQTQDAGTYGNPT